MNGDDAGTKSPGWTGKFDPLREDKSRRQGIRLFSTPESASACQVSALAVLETICATYAYGWIAARHGTLHLTIAAYVAPFLLLKTGRSTELALARTDRYFRNQVGLRLVQNVSAVVVLVLTARLVLRVLDSMRSSESLVAVFRSTVGEFLALTCLTVFWTPLMAMLLAPGLLLEPTFHRISATVTCSLRSPVEAIAQIPLNWYRYAACMDMMHVPEVLPGVVGREKELGRRAPFLNPWGYLGTFLAPYSVIDASAWRARLNERKVEHGGTHRGLRFMRSLLAHFLLTGTLFFTALPSLLYRWSLKGTALLFFPLVFVVWDAPSTKPEYLKDSITAKAVFAGACAILLLGLGGMLQTALGTHFGLLRPYELVVDSAASHPVASLFFPKNSMPTWQALVLIGSGVTVGGYLYANRLQIRGYSDGQKRALEVAFYAIGVVAVCTVFALIFAASRGIR